MTARPIHVSLIAVPDCLVGPVTGLYEAFDALQMLADLENTPAQSPPFRVEIVGPTPMVTCAVNGLVVPTHRRFGEVESTDIAIAPSMMVDGLRWVTGRHAEAVAWMRAMHAGGTRLCGACTGALLLAETGLLDGREATVHPAFASTFRDQFPGVRLRPESVLVASGDRGEFVTSGASAAWHDLVLYLVAQHAGAPAAQALARFMLLQWHEHGQGPYIPFVPTSDHDDGEIRAAQQWLAGHFSESGAGERLKAESSLPERSFKRRFKRATGYALTEYIQHLRIEEAKRRLETTDEPADDVALAVGYENAAFFRRLFKRQTGVTPGIYRRRFRVPSDLVAR